MNLSDALIILATVALGLAAASGVMLALFRNSQALNSLYRARVAVLFQLTSTAVILGILPSRIQTACGSRR
jgi:hypothetical protein